jgi:N-acetylglutamate synthase-like GNAT family acetyltransferase
LPEVIILSPQTEAQFQQYYHLRWRILRKPWNQPEGSERSTDDAHCYHIMATENNIICAVARLEFISGSTAQLRYMAVDDLYQGRGIGRCIMQHMEEYARQNNTHDLFLNARESALGFYEKLGYKITEKSYLLFDSIQHFKMNKCL